MTRRHRRDQQTSRSPVDRNDLETSQSKSPPSDGRTGIWRTVLTLFFSFLPILAFLSFVTQGVRPTRWSLDTQRLTHEEKVKVAESLLEIEMAIAKTRDTEPPAYETPVANWSESELDDFVITSGGQVRRSLNVKIYWGFWAIFDVVVGLWLILIALLALFSFLRPGEVAEAEARQQAAAIRRAKEEVEQRLGAEVTAKLKQLELEEAAVAAKLSAADRLAQAAASTLEKIEREKREWEQRKSEEMDSLSSERRDLEKRGKELATRGSKIAHLEGLQPKLEGQLAELRALTEYVGNELVQALEHRPLAKEALLQMTVSPSQS